MLCAAVVLPHPPLLVPEVASGAAPELDGLRAACSAAVHEGLAQKPDRVVLAGVGNLATGDATLAPYGLAGPPRGLPLALTIGSWALDAAGWGGPRELLPVAGDAPRMACAAVGKALATEEGRTLLLAMGDGSARRSAAAPGHLDERAAAFDEAVAAALGRGDAPALHALDETLAADLLAAGRPVWQVLAGAMPRPAFARLHYHEAPYGVAYFVAYWRPGS